MQNKEKLVVVLDSQCVYKGIVDWPAKWRARQGWGTGICGRRYCGCASWGVGTCSCCGGSPPI